jgi:uncharacterized protein (TIGR01244 family)
VTTEPARTAGGKDEETGMNFQQLTPDYAVAPQITAADVPQIAAAGFRSIICNRPDAEHPGEASTADEVKAAAGKAGIEFRYIPVISGQMTQKDVDDQAAALRDLPAPVFAYCRSGARCTNLYGLVKQQRG